ncbi:MAG TPA: hypothetical protein VM328_07455 [Fimbriimonadaceae bacterium]|jgi:hypothetical protein|nr:hypothetical protein [Fimbriimonadaceae bacterium]
MGEFQPSGIQLHLITGRKHMFYQGDASLLNNICSDLDGRVFSRTNLILESLQDVTSFPGHALIGITILTDTIPESFYERERLSKTVITQISQETFQFRRLQDLAKEEGQRSALLSELEFVSGERLFLEFSEIAVSGMRERNALNHLFAHPSLSCRRLEGGFSIWNTKHIVSWSHYPKLEVPAHAWPAESLSQPDMGDATVLKML